MATFENFFLMRTSLVKDIVASNWRIADRIQALKLAGFTVHRKRMGSGGVYQIKCIKGVDYIQVSAGMGRWNHAYAVAIG